MRVLEYSPVSQKLAIELPGLPLYEVFDLKEEAFREWQNAEDQQAYFNEHIWGINYEHDSHWISLEALLLYIEDNFTFDAPVTVDSRAGDGDTPLHLASVWGDLSAIEILLAAGADPNARGDLGCSPLYNAVTFGHVRTARRLLLAGASPDDLNELNTTAREAAAGSGNVDILTLFDREA